MLQGPDPKSYVGANAKGAKDWLKTDKANNTKYFNWKTDKECQNAGIKYKQPDEGDEVSGLVQAPIGLAEDELKKYLEMNNVDMSKFGQGPAKTLKDISAELIKGESSLMKEENGSILRIVDVVVMKVVHCVTGSILVQTEQTFPD